MQPDYPDYQFIEGVPSLQTWEEACFISQQWADEARLKAQKRRKHLRIIYAVLLSIPTIVLLVLVIILIDIYT